ncbi:MAG: hypothetical protein ACK2UA_03880 [Anaerolineae bacterium]
METSEGNTHPFIVKIWLEETAEEARQPSWRGQITHVPSGQRRTFSRLPDMTAFIVTLPGQHGRTARLVAAG